MYNFLYWKKEFALIEFINETKQEIDSAIFEGIYKHLSTQNIECLIVDADAMQAINKQTRMIDKPTDVLSFPLEDNPSSLSMLGTIVICLDIALENVSNLGHTIEEELQLLFIHGVLHLKGLDHETDNGEMRLEEEKIIHQFNLPYSLIIRTQES